MKKVLVATAVIILGVTGASAATILMPVDGKHIVVPATGGVSGGPSQG